MLPAEIWVHVWNFPNEQRTWTGTNQVSALTQSTGQNPEHSTRDPPVINPKQKGGKQGNPKNKHDKWANMCRDRHSTKSHAGDPKCNVAQTQAKHEHDLCQQPSEKRPTRATRTSPCRGGISILQGRQGHVHTMWSNMGVCHSILRSWDVALCISILSPSLKRSTAWPKPADHCVIFPRRFDVLVINRQQC